MTARKTLYYIFIITFFIAVLMGYFFTMPLVNRINGAKKEIQNKQAEIEALAKKEEDLKSLESRHDNFQKQVELISKMLPKSKELSDYITQLENTAFANGLAIKSIKI